MDDPSRNDDSGNLVRGEIILEKMYLLYGYGKSNQAVRTYFETHQESYWIYDDQHEQDVFLAAILLKYTKAIIKSPGIPFDGILLQMAHAQDIPIWSDLEFYYRLYPKHEYVIVTGSLGKTTVSTWVSQMLASIPYFQDHLVGNIGTPIFQIQVDEPIGLVVEASSFMLHHTISPAPHVFILTNLFAHHLDYHQTLDEYAKDKMRLIENMGAEDVFIYPLDDQVISHYLNVYYPTSVSAQLLTFSLHNSNADCYLLNQAIYYHQTKIIDVELLSKQEIHNIQNAMMAILVGQVYGIDQEWMSYVLSSFQGVRYRFETIYQTNDVVIINDAKSTTPEATRFAIETINRQYPMYHKIVILGGKMPPEDYDGLNHVIHWCDWIYVYGKDQYRLAMRLNAPKIQVYDTLEEVIDSLPCRQQMVILYSPSCVSYDQYRSFEERGAQFNFFIQHIFFKKYQKINKIAND
ncbi:MAG: UDP-N-acetylmuramoyl-L-alanine--D-glutamate ligase [Prevotella sp.]|nr:UDP-N-acetylmuramoyl-L-alanine--D-glutamate ligase [Staphylococcus sp.]MCM1349632.1 UDP-N-acetylmuramoyl-L-alanine--D-glutamate ligase [Prevotella sp.]